MIERSQLLLTLISILLFLESATRVCAQAVCPDPPPYALLRQDENYSYLKDPVCRSDDWDGVKFITLNANEDRYLTLGGEVREWYEGFHNANFGMGPQDANGFLLQRITAYSDWHMGERLRIFGQLTSDIEVGRNGGPQPNDESKLWVEQGFIDVRAAEHHGTSLTLRIGRQEFELGAGRLVDVREGPNVRLAFDAANVILKTASWHLQALVAKPVINNPGIFDDPPNHAVTLWGLYSDRSLPTTRGGNIDLYYLGFSNKRATFDRGTARELRHTIGGRFWGSREALDYDAEAMLQAGSFGTANILAWGISANTDYKLNSLPLEPQLGGRLTLTSGDRNPRSSALGTFNPLFPTGIYFGEAAVGLNGPSNLIRVGPSVKFHLTKNVLLSGDYDVFWRNSLQDGVYGLGVNLLRSGRVNQERYIGSQPSVGVVWQANRHLSLSAAYTHFRVGPFFTRGPSPGHDVHNAGVWATYKF